MSYDINLCDPVTHDVLELDEPHDMRGGTYAMGGTTECWLNITYNYGPAFRKVLGEKGIRTIYGMTGAESIPLLEAAASRLADLIEPEPERTCRVVTDKNTVSQTQEVHTKHCSECSYVFGREQHRQLLPGLNEEFVLHAVQIPGYCPNCGAKVVEE